MSEIEYPPSLAEWAELNDRYDRLEAEEDASGALKATHLELDAVSREIKEAWEGAPLRDRMRVEWRMLKAVWRDRHKRLEEER